MFVVIAPFIILTSMWHRSFINYLPFPTKLLVISMTTLSELFFNYSEWTIDVVDFHILSITFFTSNKNVNDTFALLTNPISSVLEKSALRNVGKHLKYWSKALELCYDNLMDTKQKIIPVQLSLQVAAHQMRISGS